MSAPADDADDAQLKEHFNTLSDSDKLTYLCMQVAWLNNQVVGLMSMAQKNPAFRFMMGRTK